LLKQDNLSSGNIQKIFNRAKSEKQFFIDEEIKNESI